MKCPSTKTIAITAALLLFSSHATLAATTCSKFTATQPVFDTMNVYNTTVWQDQLQPMSAYFECEFGKPKHYYGCVTGHDNISNFACGRSVTGHMSVQGTVNHTLSDDDRAQVFKLINAEMTDRQRRTNTLVDHADTCITKKTISNIECIRKGFSGYMQTGVKKYCVEGVVSRCSGQGGSLKEGLPLKVCGGRLDWPRFSQPAYKVALIHVDPADKQKYSANPAEVGKENRQICAKFNAAEQLVPSWAMAMVALAAVFFSIS